MNLYNQLISLIAAGLLVYAFIGYMFTLGITTGLGFLIACGLAFYKGVIFKEPRIIGFIAVGYILTNLAISQVLPMVYKEAVQGTIVTALIILAVFLSIYLKGKQLQSY